MILYRTLKYDPFDATADWEPTWFHIPEYTNPSEEDFARLIFKINDIIYTEWNEEFQKALTWAKLND